MTGNRVIAPLPSGFGDLTKTLTVVSLARNMIYGRWVGGATWVCVCGSRWLVVVPIARNVMSHHLPEVGEWGRVWSCGAGRWRAAMCVEVWVTEFVPKARWSLWNVCYLVYPP